jgi:radical SAM superfamily enzyme YgiQ (UPF0313 family)
MKNIYLFELSDIFANQVYLPYSSGVVWSYCNSKPEVRNNYNLVDWFYYREDLETILSKIKNPDVLGFSCFMWNWNLNCDIAKRVKEKYPDCLIVFGGQHQPMQDRSDNFFEQHPFVDVLVHHEGEESFYEILKENLSKFPDYTSILGCTVNVDGKEVTAPPRPRMTDIQNVPSPFLDGSFDKLLANNDKGLAYNVSVESNRGCPFSCAFCEIGEQYYAKVKTSYEKTRKEIEWIAENKIEYVTDASSNFGLKYQDDYDLAMFVKEIKEKTGYPHAYRVTWLKGKADKVLNIAKVFEEARAQKGMTIALQSMNPDVLKAIKRKNIDDGKLKDFIELYEGEGIGSYVELIWGLPEETVETFKEGISQIMEYGYHNYLDIHLMMLLPNAPIASKQYIEKYGIKTSTTQPRFSHRHITEKLSNDTVEFITKTNKLTEEEWIEGHQFRWAIIFGHYLGPLQFISRAMNTIYNIPLKEFYNNFIDFAQKNEYTFVGKEYKMIKEDLRKIIDNKRHWGYVIDGAGDINWAVDESTCIRIAKGDNKIRFYEEIRSFLNNYYPQTDSDIIDEVFKYQHSRLSDPNKSYPFEEDFSYNIHDVIENGEVLQKKINKIKFDSKNYNSDIFNWAKEVLWYGRRVGRYKSTAELVG